jgi:Zn-dependent oligopeptidase
MHQLAGFVHELNQNKGLYNALVRSLDHHERLASHGGASTSSSPPSSAAAPGGPEVLEGYTREAVLVGRLLVRDFEKAGVHLPDQQRQLTAELTARIGQTGYAISKSIARI